MLNLLSRYRIRSSRGCRIIQQVLTLTGSFLHRSFLLPCQNAKVYLHLGITGAGKTTTIKCSGMPAVVRPGLHSDTTEVTAYLSPLGDIHIDTPGLGAHIRATSSTIRNTSGDCSFSCNDRASTLSTGFTCTVIPLTAMMALRVPWSRSFVTFSVPLTTRTPSTSRRKPKPIPI